MRTEMREQQKKQDMQEKLSEYNRNADRLVEKWSKRPDVGKNIVETYDRDQVGKEKMRKLAVVMENQEKHLKNLTETQISNAFSTTPENVMRVIRLGYPNSIRGELFLEWAMETARDSIYYLSPVYGKTKRGSTEGAVTHESDTYRYSSEIENEDLGDGDGTTTTFTVTLTNAPLRPYTVKVMVDGYPVATDNGRGYITGEDVEDDNSTVDYTTGNVSVTFDDAPDSGEALTVEYHFDSEVEDLYPEYGNIHLQLRDHQFRVKPYPLYVSWSKMTELLLNTTLNIDAEEAMITGAADEFKKALDFHAVRVGYRTSKNTSAVTFDTNGATGESEIDRAMAVSRAIDEAGDQMFAKVQRGGVTKIVGGPNAVSFLKLHRRFDGSTRQPRVGGYREGTLDGVDVYKVPSSIVPNDELMCIYKNEQQPEDVSVAFGSLIPLYRTQTLEFKEQFSETGLAHYGDWQTLQPAYLSRIQLQNL